MSILFGYFVTPLHLLTLGQRIEEYKELVSQHVPSPLQIPNPTGHHTTATAKHLELKSICQIASSSAARSNWTIGWQKWCYCCCIPQPCLTVWVAGKIWRENRASLCFVLAWSFLLAAASASAHRSHAPGFYRRSSSLIPWRHCLWPSVSTPPTQHVTRGAGPRRSSRPNVPNVHISGPEWNRPN
jgi:hypothetical protein